MHEILGVGDRLRYTPGVACWAAMCIGRLVPDDVIGLVRYLRDHATT
jgi:hypothetical protein